MNRRSFLGLLGMGGATLALPSLAKAAPVVAPVVSARPSTLITPTWFVYEVSKAIEKALNGHAFKYVPCKDGARIGYSVGGHVVNAQRYVTLGPEFVRQLDAPGDPDVIRERYVRPIADTLAAGLKQKRVRVLTDTCGPVAGIKRCVRISPGAAGIGVPVRGVEVYDIAIDANVFRLDVLGATA